MEIKGTQRARKLDELFLSTKRPVIYYHHQTAVKKGKWVYDVVKFCKKQGIELDLKKRPISYKRSGLLLDKLRKLPTAKKIRKIPLIGKLLSSLYWFIKKKAK